MVKSQKLYKLEPPEGGWGILICIGMAFGFISPLASMPSFGLLFGDFLKELGEETSTVAVITSLFFAAMSFAGLFTNILFRKYSIRSIALAGGIIYFLGNILQIFVQTTWQLMISFSIFQGIAFGLMVPACYTTFNNYFVRKRVMMMSFAQSLIGLGTMFYPVVIQKLMDLFGFRGCLAVLAAINAHSIFGMLIMHPVEWHMKRVPIEEQELKEICKNNYNKQQFEELNDNLENNLQPLIEKKCIPNSENDENVESSRNSLGHQSLQNENSLESGMTENDKLPKSDSSDVVANNNCNGETELAVITETKQKKRPWEAIVDFLDLTLLKKPIYVNIVLGISFALYSDIAFFTLQPMYLFELNFSKVDTATIIAIGAAADLFSRIFLAFGSAFVTMSSRNVYLAGAFFTVIARFAFLNVFDYTGMAIMTAILGFLRTWIHVPLPLVFGEYLPKDRFPSGYGLFMFLQGNIMFAIAPVVGYVRDVTKSYPITIHCINFFMAACAFPWILEIIYLKYFKSKKNIESNNKDPENLNIQKT